MDPTSDDSQVYLTENVMWVSRCKNQQPMPEPEEEEEEEEECGQNDQQNPGSDLQEIKKEVESSSHQEALPLLFQNYQSSNLNSSSYEYYRYYGNERC